LVNELTTLTSKGSNPTEPGPTIYHLSLLAD
jgi:hypothetical protein